MKDRTGIFAATCEHYHVMAVIDVESPEHHGLYDQVAKLLSASFGNTILLADIACRLINLQEHINKARMDADIDEPYEILQSLLHGSFHPWYCLVIRGRPWLFHLGCATGEESERVFAVLKFLKVAMQESSLVRRATLIDRFLSEMNERKTELSAASLRRRAKRVGKAIITLMEECTKLPAPRLTEQDHEQAVERLRVSVIA